MNYFNLVKNIQDTALKHQFVQEFFEGDVYDIMNTQDRKYPTVILTTERIDDTNGYQTITASLFCIDRLTSDGVNKLEVQSICQTILQGILLKLESAYPEMTIQTESFVPFTEKFKDLCAGMYVECSLSYPSMICEDEVFTTKEIILKSNGIYDVIGYDRAIVSVETPTQSKELSISANGSYTILPDEGYYLSGVNVDVNIQIGEGSGVLSNGTKLAYSTFKTVPNGYDFSYISDFSNMFTSCSSLTEVHTINTSNGTDFRGMFNYCESLTEVPQLDFSNGINFNDMFHYCKSLTTIPQIDFSNGTMFNEMFLGCSSLTTIQQLDFPNGTNFSQMFRFCTKLTTIEQLNVSKGIIFNDMFSECKSLTTIPQIDTSNGTNFSFMFNTCFKLTTIPQLDVSNGTKFNSMFNRCSSLTDIKFIGSINATIDFSSCKKLTYDSIKSILTACAATTNTKAKTLKFNRTLTDQNGELLALVESCTSKGWTITGLTLN